MKYVLIVLLVIGNLFAEYSEGFDTTESDGTGLDNTFQIGDDEITALKNAKIALYLVKYWEWNLDWQYVHHTFDEICVVPSKFDEIAVDELSLRDILNTQIVVKRSDGTFAKVHIIEQLNGLRYIYRYGVNTISGGNLIAEDYDKDKCHPPQNLAIRMMYITNPSGVKGMADLEWDPPLPNNNELDHYEIYTIDAGAIDTADPIDLNEWDLVQETQNTDSWWHGEDDDNVNYINIVAVYEEGVSKPLQGWTLLEDESTKIINGISGGIHPNQLTIENNRISFNLLKPCHAELSVFEVHGKKLSTIVNGGLPAGSHLALFDYAEFGAGMYYIHLKAGTENIVKKFVLCR